ncbi:MAG: glycosyltransferase family 1 protein [bacterium]
MRIGIDCRTILNTQGGEVAGVGHYTYFLLKNILEIDKNNKYILFFDDRYKDTDWLKKYQNVEINFFPFYQYKKYLPFAYSQMLISGLLNQKKLDVFHAVANTIPLFYTKPSIVTIHDLAIYKYPEFFPTTLLNRQTFATKTLVPKSIAKASKIIAVSKNTKSDIIEEFGIPANKIEVVYEGFEGFNKSCSDPIYFERIKNKYGVSDKYILFLGTVEPRKNIPALVRAFRNLKLLHDSPIADYQLIIAGGRGWKDEGIYTAIADANASLIGVNKQRSGHERRGGLDKRSEKEKAQLGERRQGQERRQNQPVKYIGYVESEEKICLLRQASCFVFPSLYEGFGLPVLEAMASGTPVIVSNAGSLPELVGENAGLIVSPNKENEIADAITQIVTDSGLRESLVQNALKRAHDFSWRECALRTIAVYEGVKK